MSFGIFFIFLRSSVGGIWFARPDLGMKLYSLSHIFLASEACRHQQSDGTNRPSCNKTEEQHATCVCRVLPVTKMLIDVTKKYLYCSPLTIFFWLNLMKAIFYFNTKCRNGHWLVFISTTTVLSLI